MHVDAVDKLLKYPAWQNVQMVLLAASVKRPTGHERHSVVFVVFETAMTTAAKPGWQFEAAVTTAASSSSNRSM